jgi:2,3-bisphosphoglycerate-independent phosphoglycerate mutase
MRCKPNTILCTFEPLAIEHTLYISHLRATPSMSRPDGNKALAPHPTIPRSQGPLLICILDGYGEGPFKDEYNAIYRANTPCMDGLLATTAQRRCRLLKAHGDAVGLPPDDMGNSEVGHNALGSGQIVDQGAKCVDRALKTGSVFEGEGWRYIEPAAVGKTLHLIGLLSDGGIHSR